MILKLDLTNNIVEIDGTVKISELIDQMEKLGLNINEWFIRVNSSYVPYIPYVPQYPEPISPYYSARVSIT